MHLYKCNYIYIYLFIYIDIYIYIHKSINMEPENDGFQKESPFPKTDFQVPY